jgi:Mannosylglycerate hydrolase MGH1-like glycoside hydrolase domain
MTNPLLLLERLDKHYLGSGTGIIFAPRFPRWLERPGFWDEADVYHYQLAPVFTVTFLSGDAGSSADPLAMRQVSRRWSPAELVAHYEMENGLEGWEHRSVLPGGYFMSEWKLRNVGKVPRKLLAVTWTAQATDDLDLSAVQVAAGSASFRRMLQDRHDQRLAVEVILQASEEGVGGSAYLSQGSLFDPRWELTPFAEKWRDGVATTVQVDGISPSGTLYLAAVSRVVVPARGETIVGLRAQIRPEDLGDMKATGRYTGYMQEHVPLPEPVRAVEPAASSDPGAASRSRWHCFFEEAPGLSCSDPFIDRYWYYRWYGLELCSHEGRIGNHIYPGCCEGTGYFHVPIAYGAQCHARELRWLPDPARARGVILNFLAHQKESGQLRGRIYVNHLERTDFYFADWGGAALAVDAVHPDLEFLRAVYRPLALYAEWLERERDADETGVCDVIDHYETGQEYMSRYMAVSSDADRETWGDAIRLKGVDAAVYAYRLQRALATIAGRLHEFGEAGLWTAAADRTGKAILELMWDGETGMFSDLDPRNMQRTGVKAAVCFYPYFSDLVGQEQVEGLRRHLLNPAEFWTAHPVPSTSADDPYYSPDAEWKGKRHDCPWNGRVWPMANSHLVEALARAAIEHDPTLRAAAAELIRKFIQMMFHDGDPARPNCYEHYSPDTGGPSLYRGFDDYQHSWVNDLIVKYVAGFRPAGGDAFIVDPFPFGLESLRLSRLPFRGHRVDVEIDEERFKVRVDGRLSASSRMGEPVEVTLTADTP